MDEKLDPFSTKLDGLTDQEIEARIAAALWVDDKQAFLLRYLEDKKLKESRAAKVSALEVARRSKVVASAALDLARNGQKKVKLAFTIASVAVAVAISALALA